MCVVKCKYIHDAIVEGCGSGLIDSIKKITKRSLEFRKMIVSVYVEQKRVCRCNYIGSTKTKVM